MQDYSWQKYTKIHDGIREYLKKHNSIVVAAQYNAKQHYIVYYNNDYDISVKASYEKDLNGESFHFFHLSSFLLALAYCQCTVTDIALNCQYAMNGFDSIIRQYINAIKECQTQAGKVQGLFKAVLTILLRTKETPNCARLQAVFYSVAQLAKIYDIDQKELDNYLTEEVKQFLAKEFEKLSDQELADFVEALIGCSNNAISALQREKINERLDLTYGSMVENIAKINWKIQLGD